MFLKTKVLSGTSINSNKFTLLGDPMMSLAIPDYGVRTTMFPDTVSALGKFTFTGEIINEDSVKVNNFNGEIEILVFDKEIIAQTQGQQSSSPMEYKKQTNLIYKGTARNFNPPMAMAGKITIAEVEELVEPGELDPNQIHTPGIFVQRIFQGERFEKRIEQRTVIKKS